MADYALLIDYKYCTNCHACEVSCQNYHHIPIGEWGIKVNEMGPIRMSQLDGKWLWDYVPVPSDLCDLCADRVAEGKDPACVHHCLGACMELVPLEKLGETMAAKGNKVVSYIP